MHAKCPEIKLWIKGRKNIIQWWFFQEVVEIFFNGEQQHIVHWKKDVLLDMAYDRFKVFSEYFPGKLKSQGNLWTKQFNQNEGNELWQIKHKAKKFSIMLMFASDWGRPFV